MTDCICWYSQGLCTAHPSDAPRPTPPEPAAPDEACPWCQQWAAIGEQCEACKAAGYPPFRDAAPAPEPAAPAPEPDEAALWAAVVTERWLLSSAHGRMLSEDRGYAEALGHDHATLAIILRAAEMRGYEKCLNERAAAEVEAKKIGRREGEEEGRDEGLRAAATLAETSGSSAGVLIARRIRILIRNL